MIGEGNNAITRRPHIVVVEFKGFCQETIAEGKGIAIGNQILGGSCHVRQGNPEARAHTRLAEQIQVAQGSIDGMDQIPAQMNVSFTVVNRIERNIRCGDRGHHLGGNLFVGLGALELNNKVRIGSHYAIVIKFKAHDLGKVVDRKEVAIFDTGRLTAEGQLGTRNINILSFQ